MTSVTNEYNLGRCPPESIVFDDARLLERTQVAWLPPEPNPPPEIKKHRSNEPFNNAWCSYRAALPLNNQTLNTTESLLNEEITHCSVPVFSSSFLPLITDSVGHASRANVMQVVHGAANVNHINTSCQRNLNNEIHIMLTLVVLLLLQV